MRTTRTTRIRERYSGRTLQIKGDMVNAMKACVFRNKNFNVSGIRGEFYVDLPEIGEIHLRPDEYEKVIVKDLGHSLSFTE